MAKAKVNPKIMRWARESAGLDIGYVAKRIARPEADIRNWETGKDQPTIAQARNAASVYKRPMAVFFLSVVPQDPPSLLDYRKISNNTPGELTPEIRLLIRKMRYKQNWVREWKLENSLDKLDFVGSLTITDDPESAGVRIRKNLGFPDDTPKGFTKAKAFKAWYDAVEQIGVFVIRNKEIDPAEARGFTLADEYAPFVYVNGNDSQAAQIFTLLHELAHVHLGRSSMSNPLSQGRYRPGALRTETFCNKVASCILMPPDAVANLLTKHKGVAVEELVHKISYKFKVSDETAARKLLDLNIVDSNFYDQVRAESQANWKRKQDDDRKKRESSNKPIRISNAVRAVQNNGDQLIAEVLAAVELGKTDLLTAAKVLGAKTGVLDDLEEAVVNSRSRRGAE